MHLKKYLFLIIFLLFSTVTYAKQSKYAVVYFTWAENVERISDDFDVDAITSASVILPGNVGLMADIITQQIGADKFSIVTKNKYSGIFDECLEQVSTEKAHNTRPEINKIPSIKNYNVIFIGCPNWGGSLPMPMISYIENNKKDFEGKTIVPFFSHGTSGMPRLNQELKQSLPPDCTILKSLGIYRDDIPQAKFIIEDFLNNIKLSQ